MFECSNQRTKICQHHRYKDRRRSTSCAGRKTIVSIPDSITSFSSTIDRGRGGDSHIEDVAVFLTASKTGMPGEDGFLLNSHAVTQSHYRSPQRLIPAHGRFAGRREDPGSARESTRVNECAPLIVTVPNPWTFDTVVQTTL